MEEEKQNSAAQPGSEASTGTNVSAWRQQRADTSSIVNCPDQLAVEGLRSS